MAGRSRRRALGLEGTGVPVGGVGLPDLVGEYQPVVVGPQFTGFEALLHLADSMPAQYLDCPGIKSDPTPRRIGLGQRREGGGVGDHEQRRGDLDDAGVQIDGLPGQAEHLGASHPRRRGEMHHRPYGLVEVVESIAGLLRCPRPYLRPSHPWELHSICRVRLQQIIFDCILQSSSQPGPVVAYRLRSQWLPTAAAGLEKIGVEAAQHLRGEVREGDLSNPWNDLRSEIDSVLVDGAGANVAGGDLIGQPVEPRLQVVGDGEGRRCLEISGSVDTDKDPPVLVSLCPPLGGVGVGAVAVPLRAVPRRRS